MQMYTPLWIGLIAFVLALVVTPAVRWLAFRIGLLDQPAARKLHSAPIPLMGGAAIYLAFMVALVAALLLLGDFFYLRELMAIFLGATACALMGLIDDRHGLPPWLKLLIQLGAAAALVLTGVQVRSTEWQWLNVGITILWVLTITNAMNLLDNMDGLSAGIAAIASGFLMLLAVLSGQSLVGALCAALFGACLGFLNYNRNPASIFMGDAGSHFIGFMLAAVAIKLRFPENVTFVTWMIPVLVMGVPLFDTALVSISRLRRGLNPLTTPGKDHTSHRLLRMGYSRREAVMVLYLAGCACGMLAIYITKAGILEGYLVGAAAAAMALMILIRLERPDLINDPLPEVKS